MRRIGFAVLVVLGFWSAITSQSARAKKVSLSLRDHSNYPLPQGKEFKKIVALTPALAELVDHLDGNSLERLVATVQYTNHRPEAEKIPQVGPYFNINVERVMARRPDLILASKSLNRKDQVLKLRSLNVPVVIASNNSIGEIIESIQMIGQVMNRTQASNALKLSLKNSLEVARPNRPRKAHKIVIQVGISPLVVVGGKNYLNELVSQLGYFNTFADVEKPYPKPSVEQLLVHKPHQILVLSLDKKSQQQDQAKALKFWKKLKISNIKTLHSDALLRPYVGLSKGLHALQAQLAP